MKALILKMLLATGFMVGARAVEPVPSASPVLRMPPAAAVNPQRALPQRKTARRPPPAQDFQARALERTARDARTELRRLLAEFGEPEDAELEAAMGRHPELARKVLEAFAGPEVRSFTPLPDGSPAMSIKRI